MYSQETRRPLYTGAIYHIYTAVHLSDITRINNGDGVPALGVQLVHGFIIIGAIQHSCTVIGVINCQGWIQRDDRSLSKSLRVVQQLPRGTIMPVSVLHYTVAHQTHYARKWYFGRIRRLCQRYMMELDLSDRPSARALLEH